jgi:photosystem II stability/assembly factor-like uncharacterized protein
MWMISLGSAARGEWEFVDSGVTETLNDVYFADELHGWAVGDNSTIIHTEDGGKTWARQVCPVDSINLSDVLIHNKKVGYCIGNQSIFKTYDGGRTWAELNMDIIYKDIYRIWDMSFIDKLKGWICVEMKSQYGMILFTSDGGDTWTIQKPKDIYNGYRIVYRTVDFIDEHRGWVLGGSYSDGLATTIVFRTDDSGLTWDDISVVNGARTRFDAVSPDIVWMKCDYSFDGGITWNTISMPDMYGPVDVTPTNESRIFIWGNNSIENKQGLFSANSITGSCIQLFGVLRSFFKGTSLVCYYDKNVWVGGQHGLMIRYHNTDVSVKEHNNDIPVSYELCNSPNPFNPSTAIRFTLAEPSPVTLTVYDCTGRTVATLIDNAPLAAGEHEAVFDGSSLASGVYIYRCRAGNTTRCGRMTLMK